MGHAETFHGYAPDLGYEFLRSAIVEHDYKKRGADISADEIFISDGAKSDSGNIGDIFSVDNKIAVCDPVYPVYGRQNRRLYTRTAEVEQCYIYALYSRN